MRSMRVDTYAHVESHCVYLHSILEWASLPTWVDRLELAGLQTKCWHPFPSLGFSLGCRFKACLCSYFQSTSMSPANPSLGCEAHSKMRYGCIHWSQLRPFSAEVEEPPCRTQCSFYAWVPLQDQGLVLDQWIKWQCVSEEKTMTLKSLASVVPRPGTVLANVGKSFLDLQKRTFLLLQYFC